MLKLETKLYKYGSFKESSVIEFDNEAELLEYIENGKEYTEHVRNMSIECEESCVKWVERFTYKGIDYRHDVDC